MTGYMEWGGEILFVTQSIYEGKGFGNPFSFGQSGSTAWISPLLPYLYNFIFKIFGFTSTLSIIFIFLLKSFLLSLSNFFIWKLTKTYKWASVLSLALFNGFLLLNFRYFLLAADDISINTFFVIYLIFAIVQVLKKNNYYLNLFVLALFLPLLNPFLLLIFYLCLGYLLFLQRKQFIIHFFLIVLVSMIPLMLWGVRNYNALQTFIPVKSNFWFEFYQSNICDQDGLLTTSTYSKCHPSKEPQVYEAYLESGEMLFMEQVKQEVLHYLNNNSDDYVQNIAHRLFSGFIYMHNHNDKNIVAYSTQAMLTEKQLMGLHQAGIISLPNELSQHIFWTNFNSMSDQYIYKKFNELQIKSEVIKDYFEKKLATKLINNSFSSLIRHLSISLFPFLVVLLISIPVIIVKRDILLIILVFSYFAYTLFYAFIQIYIRYQLPLIGIFSLIIAISLSYLFSHLRTGVKISL